MTNDVTNVNLENAIPCFALSKHGSYVMSTSGGKVSLFNMMTFNLKFHQFSLFNMMTFNLKFHPCTCKKLVPLNEHVPCIIF
ncbi:hypothetical protein ACJIZ3_023600 [Penstemon smallii]|uniref:Uncharacterized protein n=1 Tax=Penstemon smallii TaxID=265156 RepID=A0ABD3TPI4_9LAMI